MTKSQEAFSEETWEARYWYQEEHTCALMTDLGAAQDEIETLKEEIQKHLADFKTLKLKAEVIAFQLWEAKNNA